MFRENKIKEKKIKEIEDTIYNLRREVFGTYFSEARNTLFQRVIDLECENRKLNDLVRELCDYVYSDNKE